MSLAPASEHSFDLKVLSCKGETNYGYPGISLCNPTNLQTNTTSFLEVVMRDPGSPDGSGVNIRYSIVIVRPYNDQHMSLSMVTGAQRVNIKSYKASHRIKTLVSLGHPTGHCVLPN